MADLTGVISTSEIPEVLLDADYEAILDGDGDPIYTGLVTVAGEALAGTITTQTLTGVIA